MSCYEALAASYDGLTRDIPYEKYLRFFKSLLKQYGVKPKTVLDLACGTGSLSVLLAKSGYAVLGVDRSEDMLTVAAEKAMELAVTGMIPSNTIGRAACTRLRVYAGTEHAHAAQKPEVYEF